MRERFILLGLGIISTTLSIAQVKKQFSVEDDKKVDKVDLNMKVNSGQCFIKPGKNSELLTVYSDQDYDSYSHSFNKAINNRVCKINLALEDDDAKGLGQSISYRMFGSTNKEPEKLWKVYLTDSKIYDLNLDYGIGHADINLSGLSVEKLKIHTGSADVNIGYLEGHTNRVEMDTFYVKVDLGSVTVNKVNLSKSKNVIADIGFGDLLLDFSDKPAVKSHVQGSVGAGKLLIVLPDTDTPVRVNINNSWLCSVKLTKSFEQLSEHTFVNNAYREDAENLLTFDLEVSMGNIIFKEKASSPR